MIGHGGPSPSHEYCASVAPNLAGLGWRSVFAVLLAVCAMRTALGDETIQVRIAWGGGAPTVWHGVIGLSEGSLAEPRLLGIEADEPGSMWLEPISPVLRRPGDKPPDRGEPAGENHLVIHQRSPRTYDGVDLLVTAPLTAKLLVGLSASGEDERLHWTPVPLCELLGDSFTAPLDEQGNRLSVRRTPGDMLQVTTSRKSLVFRTEETLKFRLKPHLLPLDADAKVQIRVELVEGRAFRGRLVAEHTVIAGKPEPLEQEVRLPGKEGVYELLFTATHNGWLRWARPVRGNEPVATRRIQFVVLGSAASEVPEEAAEPMREVVAIDPAHPKWWERMVYLPATRPLSRLFKGPLGNNHSRAYEHSLGKLVQLGPNPETGDVAWEAYVLPVGRPNQPHVFEVAYPSNAVQTLGVSLLERNEAGAIYPIGVDSGVQRSSEVVELGAKPRWLHHRVIFWPKTKSPIVLLSNRGGSMPAYYGTIRVLTGGSHLPRAFSPNAPRPERLFSAYLDRPLFPENFSASQAVDRSNSLPVDDWKTFYQSGSRLVEYLLHVGYGGLMVSVAADGSALYPSETLQPTPRYDTGVFLEAGQDPIRKDVLEMLFRMFDRDGLDLIPAIEFGAPLPELEAELRRGGPKCRGMVWIGRDGRSWLDSHRPTHSAAPYYNVLHPRVQEAMLGAVREIVGSYGEHPAFSGLAVQLSASGYAQLPGPAWGMDDATIGRFEQATKIRVPGEGPDRFAKRAEFLTGKSQRAWLEWRAEELGRFHDKIRAELAAIRPDARLYLAGAKMLNGDELGREFRPSLPRKMTITEAMLRVGIAVDNYTDDASVVLLRPQRVVAGQSLARHAVDLEIRRMRDVDRSFQAMGVTGSLFYHRPWELRLPSFDQQSPFQPSYTWLASQPVPSGVQNRRRFIHSLATLDSRAMFDGGWLLPMGQESSIRELIAAYRQLPGIRFQRLTDESGGDPAQPVTIRYASHGGFTYVYLVNDAPFAVEAGLEVSAPENCRLEALGRGQAPLVRDEGGTHWTVRLAAYDLAVFRFRASGVKLSAARVDLPDEVREGLEIRIADICDRAAELRFPPALEVLGNPDFEESPAREGEIPSWGVSSLTGTSIGISTRHKRNGKHSVRLESQGPVASLVSRPFAAPTTGRLTLSVWLRAGEASETHARLSIEGNQTTADADRFVPLRVSVPISVAPEGGSVVFPVDDLPLSGLQQLRVRIDLLGKGEMWLDHVQLCQLVFTEAEHVALLRLISPAEPKLKLGQYRDCLHLLEGYWPRFLMANVPLPELTSRPVAPPPPKKADRPPGVLDRVRRLFPERVWFF